MKNFYSAKYKIGKSNAAEKLENLSNGQVGIPKWVVIIGVIVLVGTAAIFIASIAISLTRKPNGLFNETCSSRNCEKALGLKCINKICQCAENQFYLDMCRNLSTINQPCNKDRNCLQNQFLVCGLGRKCACDAEKYWNTDLKICSLRKTYREFCNGDECKIEQKIFCDSNLKQCRCINPLLNYWNGSYCVAKKNYQNSCGTSEECIESQGLLCKNSICSCTNSEYFSLSDLKCFPKKTEFEPCSYDEMCLRPMFCSIRFGCRCPKYYFYEPTTSTCTNQYMENSNCVATSQCRSDLGLTCQANKCKCNSLSHTWSSNSIKCLLTYAKSSCLSDLDCNQMENLICSQNNNCNCPQQSTNGMCDCKKVEGDENYWNGTSCVPARTHNSSCSGNYECKTITELTICQNSKCMCSDYSLYYFDGLSCSPKKLHAESCSKTEECLDSQLTTCDGSNCVCSSVQFFDNLLSKCIDRVGEFVSCSSDAVCFEPMSCDASSGCICDSNKFFENTTLSCKDKFLNGTYCDRNWQCRSDLELVCSNNVCVCDSPKDRWSGSRCLLTFAQTLCSGNADCNDAQNLVCLLGNCTCDKRDGSEYYWNGQMCITANDFGNECESDIECKTLTQNTSCINQICSCSDPSTIYWNGVKCSKKLAYGQTCTNVYLNECMNSESTFCSANLKCECLLNQYFDTNDRKCSSKVGEFDHCFPTMTDMCLSPMTCRNEHFCSCNDDQFFENTTSQCLTKFLNGSLCDKDSECYNSKGLICQDNKCVCNHTKYTWSWQVEECKLTYSSLGCTDSLDCNQNENLFCRQDDTNCFQNITGFFCDCMREEDNEYYWDGSKCVLAKSYGALCIHDCECQTITQLTICNNSHCQCKDDFEGDFLMDKCRYCFKDEFYFNSECFFIPSNKEKLDDAKKGCKDSNRDLVKIDTLSELNFFKTKFSNGIDYWVSEKDPGSEVKTSCSISGGGGDKFKWNSNIDCLVKTNSENENLNYVCERDIF